jgi:SAM-dependent methyltransferase
MKSQDLHFDEIAVEYDNSIPDHVMRHLDRRRVALATSLVSEGRVLDVGCGTGRFIELLPARYDAVGIDVSEGMLEFARRKGIEVAQAGADSIPFEDRSFDLVTTFAVLHHLIDPQVVRSALGEMARVVKPGGAVLVWDHNPLNPYWRLLMARVPQDQGDERLVPAKEIVGGLEGAGMADVELRRMTFTPDFTPEPLLPTVARLEQILERVPVLNLLGAHNVAVARA